MSERIKLWQLIEKSLQDDVSVVLMYVLESEGSSPGRQGFCLAINAKAEMAGSIGGGIMEYKFVEMVKEKLKNNEKIPTEIRQQIHDKSAPANQSGMICSGEQKILVYQVRQEDLPVIQNLLFSLKNCRNGSLELSPSGLFFVEEHAQEEDFVFSFQSEKAWFYKEKTGPKNHLYIVGSGHCSLALSRIMSTLDFCIHLFDDRSGLNTFMKNDFVHRKTIVQDYRELKDLISSGKHHYVVIMTFGYRTDDIAFQALWGKEFRYLGMMGSKAKVEKMFEDYYKSGLDSLRLKQVHSPVGLPIKSETPEEIAISIAAEIISIKNGLQALPD
ncbi:xanthine dehydrogenase accessory factor [Pseudarcicella hirudinis]|uniref:Xanthine dehydrogenase accessory factor n=1 Tax=Pseudarcicella hirudinis TaxID=1079859 RepID=A0A1I5S3D4_9BACT|nr:XdhC/CoxI family protein [Pseudarcicella hirudinis]SFP65240.1 xanthine dehydrogenase accessory factor [Pseudarcicella hirudinis]